MKIFILTFILVINLQGIFGHGKVTDPVNRLSAWRKGFKTPPNYTDNQGFCGGKEIQHSINNGNCGICGDDYRLSRPRPTENGGTYGTGTIVKTYKSGEIIDVEVNISAAHKGYFIFNLCPLKYDKELEEEECFIPLKLADGNKSYDMENKGPGIINIKVILPNGLTCKHCVFRWEYITGNSWGICNDGKGQTGCGPQENFKSCSDISIQ
ncbi:uncharacterized protein LOC127284920 [Leptopilina boulardi]|uniref:uncharacterized protein LOC127284911 n=1 Tax=Leptopilina boulardi TaxID=63433 RepID=UPI0021F60196|nr:uncharacterized protein LOC127284911 [Leptopilina boulardi]XP_051166597.1 uncharacterized protein LOC127284919 [Leptopilina boulardi]XP_051166598.1 uncharacterized protein LOC127284920 [Leptopilina boulardi]